MKPDILMELSPNELLEIIGVFPFEFDRGHRIRVYRLCAEYRKRLYDA